MTRRSFVSSVAALLGGSGALLAGNVAVALLTTLVLPVEQRGLMVIVLTVASFVGLVGGAGVGNAYRRRQPSDPHPTQLAAAFTRVSALLVAVSALIGAAACGVMAAISDPRLGAWTFLVATALAGATQVLMVVVTDARFALGHFTAASRWAALSAGAGFAGVCVALVAGGDAATVIAAQAIPMGIVLAFAARAATRVGALRWSKPADGDQRMLLRQGLHSLVLPLSIVVVSRFDRLALAIFDTTAAVAVYALAATVIEIARLAPTAIAQFTAREVATDAGWMLVRRRLLQSVALAAAGGAVLTVIAFLVVPGVFGPAYAEAPALTAVLLGSEVVAAVVVVANLVIIGGGWSASGTRIGVAAIVVTVPLYIVGAIAGGAFGVAYARLASVGILSVTMWIVVRRRLRERARG